MSTQISDAKAQLQAAIDQKADQATVTALEARVATLEGDLAAKEAALNTKLMLLMRLSPALTEDLKALKLL